MPYRNRSDRLARARRFYKNNSQIVQSENRINRWRRNFKVTEDDLLRMLDEQKELCAVCGEPFLDGFRSLTERGTVDLVATIDHDHRCCPGEKCCGKCIRGIVHFKCNRLMGLADDDATILKKCIEYLEKHGVTC